VACDNQGGIAKNGSIPWNFPQELKYFSKVTSTTNDPTKKNAILMGRKTWESLPRRPLPNRINIVLSSVPVSENLDPNIVFVTSIETALEYVTKNDHIEQLFVIGGEQIYNTFMTEYLTMIDHIYYTEIQENYECDQFFPNSSGLCSNEATFRVRSEGGYQERKPTLPLRYRHPYDPLLSYGRTRIRLISENQEIIYYRYDNIKDIKT